MEKQALLQSPQNDYHSCQPRQLYKQEGEREGETSPEESEHYLTSGSSQIQNNGQESTEHRFPNFADSQNSPVVYSTNQTETCSGISKPEHREDSRSANLPEQEHEGNNHPRSAGEDGRVAGSTVSVKDQRKRMTLLVLIGFMFSCAGRLHSPLMTQYTYQVYSEQVFGNLSSDIHVSKQPCINSSQTDTETQQVQDQSSDFLAHTALIDGGISIFANLLMGTYSDVLGRKLVLLLPFVGHFLRNAAAPIIIYWDLGLPGMYVGYALDGLFGGACGVLLGLYVYTADITAVGGERTLGIAVIDVAIGFGQCFLNVLAGLVIEDLGYFYPSLVAAVMLLICIFLILLLPETVPRDKEKVTCHKLSPIKMSWRIIRTFSPRDNVYRRALLLLGLTAFFIATIPTFGTGTVESLYLMDRPFCWSSLQQGILGSARDLVGYIMSLVLIKLLKNVVSIPFLSVIGFVSEIGKNVTMALAKDDLTVYMVIAAGSCSKLMYPTLRALLSSLVPKERQGAMFAGIAVIESVCYCVSSTILVATYKATLSFMTGFVFLVVTGLQFVVVIICIINIYLNRKFKASHVTVVSIQTEANPVKDCDTFTNSGATQDR